MIELLAKLNGMFDAESFNADEFISTLKLFTDEFMPELKYLDFTLYSEEKLAYIKEEKMKEVRQQNFATAAEWRDKEKYCQYFVELRQKIGFERSMFYFDGEFLCYFYMGNCTNDTLIRELYRGLIDQEG